jgi:hypothetical protein
MKISMELDVNSLTLKEMQDLTDALKIAIDRRQRRLVPLKDVLTANELACMTNLDKIKTYRLRTGCWLKEAYDMVYPR